MAKGGSGGGGRRAGGGGRRADGRREGAGGGESNITTPSQVYNLDFDTETNTSAPVNPGGTFSAEGKLDTDITDKQAEAIIAYSGGHVPGGDRFAGINAEKLNKSLYDPTYYASLSPDMKRKVALYKAELNASLDKVKKYQGETYRVIKNYVDTATRSEGIASSYQVGKTITFNEFLSTSRRPDSAFPYLAASSVNTRIKIQGKTGRLIENRSIFGKDEAEVTYQTGRTFMVTSKKWNTRRYNWDIEMTEVD